MRFQAIQIWPDRLFKGFQGESTEQSTKLSMHSPRRVDRINKCPVARIPPTIPPFCILKDVPKTLEMEKELAKKAICFCCRCFCFHHPLLLANVGTASICHKREESHTNRIAVLTTAKRCGHLYYSCLMLMLNLKVLSSEMEPVEIRLIR